MLVLDSYGKNVYIGEELVGYIDRYGNMFINGKKFAFLTEDGKIMIEENYEAGYIDDCGDVYLNHKKTGHITENNDIYFSPKAV
ncbi:MAG: hypothetical protein WC148_01445 [Bacilli bacterium]|jgi:hypothetical protein